jgi:hypothetical protein
MNQDFSLNLWLPKQGNLCHIFDKYLVFFPGETLRGKISAAFSQPARVKSLCVDLQVCSIFSHLFRDLKKERCNNITSITIKILSEGAIKPIKYQKLILDFIHILSSRNNNQQLTLCEDLHFQKIFQQIIKKKISLEFFILHMLHLKLKEKVQFGKKSNLTFVQESLLIV